MHYDTDKLTVSALNYKACHLVCTMVVLVFNGMAAFQYTEATFGDSSHTILDSL